MLRVICQCRWSTRVREHHCRNKTSPGQSNTYHATAPCADLSVDSRDILQTHFPRRAHLHTAKALVKKGQLNEALDQFDRLNELGTVLSPEDNLFKHHLMLRCHRYSDIIKEFGARLSSDIFGVGSLAGVDTTYVQGVNDSGAFGATDRTTKSSMEKEVISNPSACCDILKTALHASASAITKELGVNSKDLDAITPLTFLELLKQYNLPVDNNDYFVVLQALKHSQKYQLFLRIFEQYIESDLLKEPKFVRLMLEAMAATGDFDTAVKLTKKLSEAIVPELHPLLVRVASEQIKRITVPTHLPALFVAMDTSDTLEAVSSVLSSLRDLYTVRTSLVVVEYTRKDMLLLLTEVKKLIGGIEKGIKDAHNARNQTRALTRFFNSCLTQVWDSWRELNTTFAPKK